MIGKPGTGARAAATQQSPNMQTGTLSGSSRILAGNQLSIDMADASPFSQKKSITDVSKILISRPINEFVFLLCICFGRYFFIL